MKKVNRRNFLKLLGAGAGAAALAYAPVSLLSGAGQLAGGEQAAFSFGAEGALPGGARSTIASLVLQGHVRSGDRVSGFLTQRIVAGYPARQRAETFPGMGLTGRIDKMTQGSTIEMWGTVEDAANRRALLDRSFHISIDRAMGTVTYRFQGRNHLLKLKEFNGQ
ncbi:MAG: twin-arginine translocation signal domain-containing protein [Nitrospirales bacterium]